MIGYTTIGVKDLERAKKFYCDLFAAQDAQVLVDVGRLAMIGPKLGKPMVAVCTPYNGEAPDPGNGGMIAFSNREKPAVDALHARALELGATCDGPPGQRIADRFYGAYVHDPDGNKLCFYVFG